MTGAAATAPDAPGRLGTAIGAADLLAYLEALGDWRDRRRAELDELDQAALQAADADALSGDVLLSMALWKAVADRHDLLLATWDSGRVGPAERERMSTLIWGRLDAATGAGALAVSLPEACKLSDALGASLRARLALEPGDADLAARLRALRAQVERIRDLIEREPAGRRDAAADTLDKLDRRVGELAGRAKRGADVGGSIAPLEVDAARTERDLIVGAATRREQAADAARARELRADLAAQGAALRDLAGRVVATVTPAPRLAIPDVTALGPVPDDPSALSGHLARLDTVRRALGQAQAAYTAALSRRDELRGRLDGYHAKAATGHPGVPVAEDLVELHRRAQQVLASEPVDLNRLGALVAAYQAYLAAGGSSQGGTR
jgi:hypothetical protein